MNQKYFYCLSSARGENPIELHSYSINRTMGVGISLLYNSSYLLLPIMFIGLHLCEFQMKMIVICVYLVPLLEHLINTINEINFFE